MNLNLENLKKNDKEVSCCCEVVDCLHLWWDVNKYRVSAPLAVGLSFLGGVGSILASQYIISSSIVSGVTNVGVFFSGIALSAFSTENKKLSKDNESLANERNDMVRRLTLMPYNNILSQTPNTQRSIESIEPINFAEAHRNNVFNSSINTFAFPTEE